MHCHRNAFDFSGINNLTMTSSDGSLSDTDVLNLPIWNGAPESRLDPELLYVLYGAALEAAALYGIKPSRLGLPERVEGGMAAFQGSLDVSAPADSIDRTAAIHRCASPYADSGGPDTGSHHRSRDRPCHQPDAGSNDAAGRITDVLAVHHGTGRFTACDHESCDQQR